MSVIPCIKNKELRAKIEEFSEALRKEAHTLGNHGLTETEFYASGLFRGSIERIRGQFSATMTEKRDFARQVLDYMGDRGFITSWKSAGEDNRHDYTLVLKSGKVAVIELKGCLDGNNTTIYERPLHAQEFIIWSVCTNAAADPRHNAWSGIHTRLSADIIHRQQLVDGVIIWDMVCGTIGRPCPKLMNDPDGFTEVGPYKLPPPCIYLFPGTIPSPRNNPHPPAQRLEKVEILAAFKDCFGGEDKEINYVDFQVDYRGKDLVRTTTVRRGNEVQKVSGETAIRRA